MSNYSEFFLNGSSSVVQLETLEISHPSFSKVYRIVRNNTLGLSANIEGGSLATFDYYPLSIKDNGLRDNLDASIVVNLGDVGGTLPAELDLVAAGDTFSTKPVVKYRTYRSDVLSAPMLGPYIFEIATISFNEDGATFVAQAPTLNMNRTGELYRLNRFEMLRGYL